MNRLARVFVLLNEIWIHVLTSLNVLPGEQHIISRHDTPNHKSPRLISHRYAIEFAVRTSPSLWDKRDRGRSRDFLIILVLVNRSLNPSCAGPDTDLHRRGVTMPYQSPRFASFSLQPHLLPLRQP